MQLTSPAFTEGAAIPRPYTGDGRNVSPPLRWEGIPEAAASLALVGDDPDAPRGTWVHWVLFNLPPDQQELPEATPTVGVVAGGALQGKNDFGKLGYGGPAPPRGKPHRYFFRLYALDRRLDLKEGATRQQLDQAMKGHVLDPGGADGHLPAPVRAWFKGGQREQSPSAERGSTAPGRA